MDDGCGGSMAEPCVSGDGQAEDGVAGKQYLNVEGEQYLNVEGAIGECTSLHRL